jgi:hypothetical protein
LARVLLKHELLPLAWNDPFESVSLWAIEGIGVGSTEALIRLAPCSLTNDCIGSDPGTLEIDLERGVEQELKWLILSLTHWVLPSRASSSRSNPHEY